MSEVTTKPREWWIAARYDGGWSAHEFPADYSGYLGAKHVVEYSAIQEAYDANEELVKQLTIQENKCESAQKEIARLHRVIAKELSENDELGCEFVYVTALKAEIAELKALVTARYGRKRSLDYAQVAALSARGLTWGQIANKLKVSKGAVQHALRVIKEEKDLDFLGGSLNLQVTCPICHKTFDNYTKYHEHKCRQGPVK